MALEQTEHDYDKVLATNIHIEPFCQHLKHVSVFQGCHRQ